MTMWTCNGCGLQGLDCMCAVESNDCFDKEGAMPV